MLFRYLIVVMGITIHLTYILVIFWHHKKREHELNPGLNSLHQGANYFNRRSSHFIVVYNSDFSFTMGVFLWSLVFHPLPFVGWSGH